MSLKIGPAKLYCQVGSKSAFLEPLLEEAYSYGFEEIPDYGKLKLIIEKMLMDEDEIPNQLYSWA